MTINYAEQYQIGLMKAYSENGQLFSQALWNSPSNSLIKFIGAKTIKVPTLDVTSGRKDRARRAINGSHTANYSNDYETFEVEQERYWETLVDPLDINDSNQIISIGNITKVYNDQQKIPEMDSFAFSKIYAEKAAAEPDGVFAYQAPTARNVLKLFDELMQAMDEAGVPSNRVLYTTAGIKTAIKNAANISRSISVQNNNGKIDRVITSLDDVEIVAVPASRFKTLYNFTTGAVADPSAKQIHMILVHVASVIAPQKYTFSGLDQPSASTSGNYLYYEEAVEDMFILPRKSDGIQIVIDGTEEFDPLPEVEEPSAGGSGSGGAGS
jgi:hypothetical protein